MMDLIYRIKTGDKSKEVLGDFIKILKELREE
jgi:hypothetical protein